MWASVWAGWNLEPNVILARNSMRHWRLADARSVHLPKGMYEEECRSCHRHRSGALGQTGGMYVMKAMKAESHEGHEDMKAMKAMKA